MATNTTNFNFIKPAVNDPTDQNLWGGYLNTNLDTQDALFLTARDYLTETASSTYTGTTSDRKKVVLCDASGGAFDVDLVSAATAGDGFVMAIVKTDSSTNAVTIDPDGSETINGAVNKVLSTEFATAEIVSDGINWHIFNQFEQAFVPQVLQTKYTTQQTTNSTSYVDATGLTISITPQKDTFKVLLNISISASQGGQDGANSDFRVLRQIDGGGYSNITSSLALCREPSQTEFPRVISKSLLDEPATDLQVDYKIQVQSSSSSSTITLQNSSRETTLIAQEIIV